MTPPAPRLWTASRKEAVVLDILSAKITKAEAMETYGIAEEEMSAWIRRFRKHGRDGLKAMMIQELRP